MMKSKYMFCRTLLPAAIFVLVLARVGLLPADEPMRVMSFNIRYGTANDGDNHWRLRKELVVKTINDYAPDLLGTQETIKFQADFLAANLTGYSAIGWSREKDPDKGEQCTIFFKTDRFQKVKTGQFWLSESPDVVASKSWDSSLPRIATWVRLRDTQNSGKEFLFVNTHFDHRGSEARHESAKLIVRKLAKFDVENVVVTGDFNCGESSAPYQAIVGASGFSLQDSFRVKHPQQVKSKEGTFNGFRGTDSGARIDWVLHSGGFRTQSAEINKTNLNGRYPSDHFPVTASLQFK